MRNPGNYGFIPHTLSDDGDPCDVIVAGSPGVGLAALMSCKAVGCTTFASVLTLELWPLINIRLNIRPNSPASKGDFHVESATTGNRDPCRDRQPGFRDDCTGSDAAISLEKGGTVQTVA